MTLLLLLTLVICVAGALAFPYLRFKMLSAEIQSGATTQLTVIGHRGFSAQAPENTLAAFREGMKYAGIIELDVHLTKDDSVVVIHDNKVDRTTNGKGAIAELTYAQIASMDAGSWFAQEFAGEKVPTLSQVLDLVQGKCMVLIELKWPEEGNYEQLVTRVVDVIRNHRAEGWTIIQSFEYTYLEELHRMAPDITYYQLLYGTLSWPRSYFSREFHLGRYPIIEGIAGMAVNYKYLSPTMVASLKAKKLKVIAWTVNDSEDIRRVYNLGVDGIITDNPAAVNKELHISNR